MRSEKGDGGMAVAGWRGMGGRRRYRVENEEERERKRKMKPCACTWKAESEEERERERCTEGTWHRGDEGATRLLLQCSK